MEIIIKNFQPHYNVALGKVVTSQKQYNEEIKRGNYIPYEKAQERDVRRTEERKKFSVSEEAQNWMRGVRAKADSKGNVKLSDNEITALQKGVTTNRDNPALKEALAARDNSRFSSQW